MEPIEKLDDSHGKNGYRVKNDTFDFYDVFYRLDEDTYLISEEFRFRQHNSLLKAEPIVGPTIIGTWDSSRGVNSVDQRCLEIIKQKFQKGD